MHVHASGPGHSHPHPHSPPQGLAAGHGRAFAIGVALNVLFVAAEAVCGFLGGSLALLADAGHNLGDVGSLLLAWAASVAAATRPTARRTYGLRRATILAALASAALLLLAVVGIAWEAVGRWQQPEPVDSMLMMVVAGIGVVVNGVTALLFVRGSRQDLNLRGAFLHMAADTGVSLAVLVAGAGIAVTGWLWLDPALSLGIVAVILVSTWSLARESWMLAVDAVPRAIDPSSVKSYLLSRPGVEGVHDLHIWALSTTQCALTAHLVIPEGSSGDDFLERLTTELERRFGIDHATIQIERGLVAPCGAMEECR